MEQKKPFASSKAEKETLAHKAGDKIERLGEKVIKAGLPKTGKAIYNAGNKLEHSGK
jgi:hypothetical protein